MIAVKTLGVRPPCARGVESALPLAIDITTFELRQRQSEWSRHGREDLAEAFRRIEVVVGGIEP